MNWKNYFNKFNFGVTIGLFALATIVDFIIKFHISLTMLIFLGPAGWPLIFYKGASLFPFLGGNRQSSFSILNITIDLIVFYIIVLISGFIIIKLKDRLKLKKIKFSIFLTSCAIVVLMMFLIMFIGGITKSRKRTKHYLKLCDINKDLVCNNHDLIKFNELFPSAKGAHKDFDKNYNQQIDIFEDGVIDNNDLSLLKTIIEKSRTATP